MLSMIFWAFSNVTKWVRALRTRLHLFRLALLRCFLLAENDYAASSRPYLTLEIRISRKKHTRTRPTELCRIKTGSSKWLKTKAAHLSNFHWQSGYGIFSISPSHRLALESFITNQAEHHRLITFQDEYRQLLRKYDVECDERYVWD